MPSKKRKDVPSEYASLVGRTCYIYLEIWDEVYSNVQYSNIYPLNVTEYYVLEHAPIEKPPSRIELTYDMYEKYELPVKIAIEKEKTTKKRKTVPDSINNSHKRMTDLPHVVLSELKDQMNKLNQRQTEIVQKYWGILIMTRDHPSEKESTVFSALATQGVKEEHFEEQLFEKLIEYKISKASQPEGGTTYRTYLFSGFKTATMCPSCYCAQRQLLYRLGINNFFNYWITNSSTHSPTTCIKNLDLYKTFNDLLLYPLMVGLPSKSGFSTTFDTPAHDIPLSRADGHEQCCVDYERTLSNCRNKFGKTHKFSIIGIPLCTESSSKSGASRSIYGSIDSSEASLKYFRGSNFSGSSQPSSDDNLERIKKAFDVILSSDNAEDSSTYDNYLKKIGLENFEDFKMILEKAPSEFQKLLLYLKLSRKLRVCDLLEIN